MSRLLSYYGDDFTGSTDVIEALASRGVKTVLFTRVPTAEEFAPFKSHNAIGLAGTSRSQTPHWMDENLPAIFAWLKSLDAKFCHYKICSTFDSSPQIGSIGRAIEIGLKAFDQNEIAMIVGAPQLKRYTFAGHLFAGYQGQTYRIDRHPVMSKHPVTPMDESELRFHLAKQTYTKVDFLDVYDSETQVKAGHHMLNLSATARPFIVGSSGVEYALLAAMKAGGENEWQAQFEAVPAVPQILVIAGSLSATTQRQIEFSCNNGFVQIIANTAALAQKSAEEEQRLITLAAEYLAKGKSPLIDTSANRIDASSDDRNNIGQSLGQIARRCMEHSKLKRIVIAGGDTSSHALSELDIFALTMRHPLPETPGSPLCRAHSAVTAFDGLEIAMKGGQVGHDDYFVKIRDGDF
jgi:3-oxoisoapionate kinase